MTRLAFCSISALDRPLPAAAEIAASAGLDGLEVTARPPHVDPEAGVAAARDAGRVVRIAGVEIVAYGSYLGRPEVAAQPVPDEGEQGYRRIIDLMRTTCDLARAPGITVVVERHFGSFADTPERIERLLADVDRPNFALNYQVLDALPESEAANQPQDAERLVRHARYFHLKNYRTSREEKGPLRPGGSLEGGVLDYQRILNAALDAGYSGPMTFEFLSWEPKPLEEKLAADVAFVRRVLAERQPT
jgi:sugar phosphate isomerase/epimerase